jgi:Ala-tRNA(Pro) deacylase
MQQGIFVFLEKIQTAVMAAGKTPEYWAFALLRLPKIGSGLNKSSDIPAVFPKFHLRDDSMTDAIAQSADDLFRFLDELGIAHKTQYHEPVFTVAEAGALRDEVPGAHTKNLFVKDKKDQFFLLTVEEHAVVDLKTVHTLIGAASKVSFGKPEKLMEFLGVIPGSVTVLGAINDTGQNVTFVLDADLMRDEIINCHPLSNDATTSLASADLIRFLEATGHTPLVLKVTA